MLPKVVLYNAVSLDGRDDWIAPYLGQFYQMLSCWKEDATLAGADTLLVARDQQGGDEGDEPQDRDPQDTRPLLVVVDSRGRVGNPSWLRKQPYWRDVVMLCSRSTPKDHLSYLDSKKVEYLVVGEEKVDLRSALEQLNELYGIRVVRVESGGTLNGALLRAGLVDEVSLMIAPTMVGGSAIRPLFRAPDLTSPDGVINLKLLQMEKLEEDCIWLRYEVVKKQIDGM
ncbi:MAG: RibD family protein [Chloroflexota bacterium]|jgi:2,5-diamino-6-(ribosylamino)-4(3H)-pyrimidinone 5'-phosphate reductase